MPETTGSKPTAVDREIFIPSPLQVKTPLARLANPLAQASGGAYDHPMQTAAQIIGVVIASAAWVAILASPFFLLVPRLRRWWTAPVRRRAAARRQRRLVLEQARRDARTEVLEAELDRSGSLLEKYGSL